MYIYYFLVVFSCSTILFISFETTFEIAFAEVGTISFAFSPPDANINNITTVHIAITYDNIFDLSITKNIKKPPITSY